MASAGTTPDAALTGAADLARPTGPAGSATSDPRTTPAPARYDWVDLARGFAVVAVVLFHVSIGQYYGMEHADAKLVAWWDRINQIITVVRMPLLFTVSGMLAAGKIRRGFRGGKALEASVTNAYLFLVWMTIYGALLAAAALTGREGVPFQVTSVPAFLVQYWAPNTPLWYVYALAVYLLVFTALRSVHPLAVLTLLVVLHLATTQTYTLESPLWTRGLLYAIYFGLGVYGGRLIRAVAANPALGALFTGLAYLLYQHLGMTKLMSAKVPEMPDALVVTALYVCAGLGVFSLAALVCRAAPYRAIGRYVGSHTLAIYVLHIPAITVLSFALEGPLFWLADLVRTNETVDVAYPFIGAAIVVTGCLAVEAFMLRCGLRWAFALPTGIRLLVEQVRLALAQERPLRRAA
ncbi:acyltransferase family protein [Agilicoccus flavus]|uniref:acyltransferase family protein n=1 Tax=Agilicoccus flavus TaxID=2775968 RepID=UPI001CF66224|nr:acyltransferase [Agilicoccus flavus]